MPRSYLFPFALCAVLSFGFAQQSEITVQSGDTLWDLARKYDTSVSTLRELNQLESDVLKPGTTLLIPSGDSSQIESYTVKAGDTLYDISVAFQIPLDELIAINNIDGTTIKPGQVLQLTTASQPEPLVVTVKAGDTLWDLAKEYESNIEAIKAQNNLISEKIRPGDSLTIPGRYAAATNADQGGAAPITVQVASGDTLWSIAKRYNTSITALMSANELPGQTIRTGQSLKIVPSSELAAALPAPPPAPIPAAGATMIWPIQGEITSRFGYRRLRIGGSNFHTGLDIDGETGDPIHAATAGVVSFSGWSDGYGNLVIITLGDTDYYYAHASELLVNVGDVISIGQTIALVGSTGRSTGSHLHFEIRVNGESIDPLPILEQSASR
ncbi:MAG: LysM peptidoglycan-binding domain-containing protein [Trueperaceae bacterium]|nr:LysM peptidoglycan-binding domain-containing protein [Trueperaceae bacterium]